MTKSISNPGDVVLSPFMGIGSEGVCAMELGRKFIGIELKREYWEQACDHLGVRESTRDLFNDAEAA
jgi:DNA modification methylase